MLIGSAAAAAAFTFSIAFLISSSGISSDAEVSFTADISFVGFCFFCHKISLDSSHRVCDLALIENSSHFGAWRIKILTNENTGL